MVTVKGLWSILLVSAAVTTAAAAQVPPSASVTSPRQYLGYEVTDDYTLSNYDQLTAYWRQLDAESDRLRMFDIGPTSEGRRQYMLAISAPENLAKLDHHRTVAAKLAHPYGVGAEEASRLAKDGRAFIWIDGCLHTKEPVPCQALFTQAYELASRDDAETRFILENNILLLANANPDGMQALGTEYMSVADPKKRAVELRFVEPYLTPRNAGHDNNRDFYFAALPETANMNRVIYRDWNPVIYYNPHQTGPAGGSIFIPPFREPPNYYTNPLILARLAELGSAMHGRLLAEDKPGSYQRNAASYSQWANGSSVMMGFLHNTFGVMSEVAGAPHPVQIPLVPDKQISQLDLPAPIAPQIFRFGDALAYQLTVNRAVMSYAAKNREQLLWETYLMRAKSIADGGKDSWTVRPRHIQALKKAAEGKAEPDYGANGAAAGLTTGNLRGWAQVDEALFEPYLRAPAERDPRGFILPADQADFPNAVDFANALIKAGVTVEKANAPFTVQGKNYPVGSLVVRTAQPFRPHILDMFEPQNHPDDIAYPGGPPKPPYDLAGYTLAFQMGVAFDRVLEGFDGPFEPLQDVMAAPAGQIVGSGAAGWLVRHEVNNSFTLTSRLLKAKQPVYWLKAAAKANGEAFSAGAVWVPASPRSRAIISQGVTELGLDAHALRSEPSGDKIALKLPRIALYDQFGGLMPVGWTRWVLEKFEIPSTTVYASQLDRGGWLKSYDAVVFSDGSVTAENAASAPIRREDVAPKYAHMVGGVTAEKTMPQVARFAREGGTVIGVGSGAGIGAQMDLPAKNHLVETVGGQEKALPSTKFYVAGSILSMKVDPTEPLAFGAPEKVDVMFNKSPVFSLPDSAKPIGSYEGKDVLRSGWALGQSSLDGGAAIASFEQGEGRVVLIGPDVIFRGGASASYRFLLNSLFLSATK